MPGSAWWLSESQLRCKVAASRAQVLILVWFSCWMAAATGRVIYIEC